MKNVVLLHTKVASLFYLRQTSMTTVLSSRLQLPLEMEKTRKAGNDKASEARKIGQSRSRSRQLHLQAEVRCVLSTEDALGG
jgi:hypothetical protein